MYACRPLYDFREPIKYIFLKATRSRTRIRTQIQTIVSRIQSYYKLPLLLAYIHVVGRGMVAFNLIRMKISNMILNY